LATLELSKLGRYELRRILGRGAMGVVYEGFDPNLGRRVAVKTILKSNELDAETERAYSARFIQEAKAVARLNHPNIVQVYDFGLENEVAYLVMEFIEGREIRSFFDAHESFSIAESVRIMGDLLDALDFAHEAGVIHRDVKPANVMLDVQRRAKLADFGVARIQGDAQRSVADTMVGTPAFMSPEQISGQKIDRRTDIFSAGNILYQLLTGQQPFKGEGAWTVVRAIMQDDPPSPSSIVGTVSPIFDGIVNKALAKKPEQRFANAREFAAALRAALSGKNEASTTPAPADKGAPEPRASETELEFWRAIQNSTDPEEFEFYLDQFPKGTYSQLARHKIAKLREPLLAKEAEESARRDAEAMEARRKEEQARLQAEESARRAAEEKAAREVEEEAVRMALEKTKREAAEKAKREAEEETLRKTLAMARREAAEKAKRQADDNAFRERAPAESPDTSQRRRKSRAVPVIATLTVIAGAVWAYLMVGRAPVPVTAPVADIAPVQKAERPQAPPPAVDLARLQRETEERIRKEFAEKAAVERAAMDKAVAEKAAVEKASAEKIAMARTTAERISAEKNAEKATADRIAAEKASAEKAAAMKVEKAAVDKAAAEKAATERIAAEKAVAEKAAVEKATLEKAAAAKLVQEKAASVKAATAATKPGWPSVGDRWVYDVRESNRPDKVYQAVVEVQSITSSSVRDVFTPVGGRPIALTHQPGAYVIGVAPGIFRFSPYLHAFQELRVGERWSNIDYRNIGFCERDARFYCTTANAHIVGKERVSVRAGTYNAWRIVVELRMGGILPERVEFAYWYAEEVKGLVKYQVSPALMGNLGYMETSEMELVSHTPAVVR
jgi:serine/threonine protein kinase